jgi:hypothetical protein
MRYRSRSRYSRRSVRRGYGRRSYGRRVIRRRRPLVRRIGFRM